MVTIQINMGTIQINMVIIQINMVIIQINMGTIQINMVIIQIKMGTIQINMVIMEVSSANSLRGTELESKYRRRGFAEGRRQSETVRDNPRLFQTERRARLNGHVFLF